jgi:uncharacterized protein (TIGR02452 family)
VEVNLVEALEAAIDGTVEYPPGSSILETPTPSGQVTEVRVRNTTTLDAAKELSDAGSNVVVLNFASAKNPGGGFLSGARAQEEYLCRSSGLFACLEGQPMYDYHRTRPGTLYTDYAIYSPDVPVIRDDRGDLLDHPWPVGVITCAAVNARHLFAEQQEEVEPAMRERINKVLAIGLAHGHDAIVLGAWGCGAFQIDATLMARLLAEALDGPFLGAYRQVTFAITDWSEERRFIGPFQETFAD